MNVILLERIDKLGQMGELVNVKSGFARNFLFPKGKAIFASKENIKQFDEQKVQLEGENIAKKNEASQLAQTINLKEVIIIRAASEAGQLYGSVSAKDISETITKAGLTINKSQVNLNKSLKTLSYEDVNISLHPEVIIKIKLNIARSKEEASEQNKLGRAIINTETSSGDIRSERAQKDAKRFDKKEDKTSELKIDNVSSLEIKPDTNDLKIIDDQNKNNNVS